jgi:hypothetical protein
MKHSRLRVPILILSIAAISACRGTGVEPSSADPATVDRSVSIEAASSEVQAVSASVSGQGVFRPSSECAPLVAPVGLVVRSTRHVKLFVREIRTRVSSPGPAGIRLPPVTFPAPQLIQEFGTNLVQARSQRLFPLRVPVGCGVRGVTVAVEVDSDDEHGRRYSGGVTVRVR